MLFMIVSGAFGFFVSWVWFVMIFRSLLMWISYSIVRLLLWWLTILIVGFGSCSVIMCLW